MKRWIWLAICVCLLVGCSIKNEAMDEALSLRSAVLQAKSCDFAVRLTADYGDMTYSFAMDCIADDKGNVTFTVTQPETIAGITGRITADGGALTFDDKLLYIPMLTDDQITPISGPWLLIRTLRGGYISSCADGRITANDSYEDGALTLDILLNDSALPRWVDVYWNDRRILAIEVTSFVLS